MVARPGPNLEASSPSTRCSAPPPTTHTHHSLPTLLYPQRPLCLPAAGRFLTPRPLCCAFLRSRVLKTANNSRVCIGLPPLCTLSCTRFLCFQQLAASFPETPGWGVSRSDSWTLGRGRRGLPVKERHRRRSFRVGKSAAEASLHSGMSTGFSRGSASSVALPRCK